MRFSRKLHDEEILQVRGNHFIMDEEFPACFAFFLLTSKWACGQNLLGTATFFNCTRGFLKLFLQIYLNDSKNQKRGRTREKEEEREG